MRFCIRDHLLKLCRGHLLKARAPQIATHGVKCHAQNKVPQLQNMYFIERKWKSLKATERDFYEFILQYFKIEKVWKRQKEIFMNLFYSISKRSWHINHCIMYKYVCIFCIRKTRLLTEFYTHYSLLWFSFQKSGLILDEWQVEDDRWFG